MERASRGRGPTLSKSPTRRGFDFTAHMRMLCADMVSRLPELRHVRLDQVAITFSQARKRVTHGLFATTTPMRFEGGAQFGQRNGSKYAVEQVVDAHGLEMLYLVSFYLPRFLDIDFQEKLVTIFHELWHISPEFNGDLRRHGGRYYAHSPCQREYDRAMQQLAARWLAEKPPPALYAFLHCNFDQLERQFGSVYGQKVRQPRLIPVGI